MTGGDGDDPEDMQFFPWERQSTYWHTRGSGRRQSLEYVTELCPATYYLSHFFARRQLPCRPIFLRIYLQIY